MSGAVVLVVDAGGAVVEEAAAPDAVVVLVLDVEVDEVVVVVEVGDVVDVVEELEVLDDVWAAAGRAPAPDNSAARSAAAERRRRGRVLTYQVWRAESCIRRHAELCIGPDLSRASRAGHPGRAIRG